MTGRVIVLGASGLVGREIIRQAVPLLGSGTVVAGVRRTCDMLPLEVEQRIFDAETAASIPAICGDAGYVINCVMGSPRAMMESCRGAIASVAGRPDRRLLHFSSIAVFGTAAGTIGEDAPHGIPADRYAAIKIESERMLADAQDASWTILRPGLVHGPGSTLWTLRIARLITAGRLGPMGARGEAPCNLVSVGDVAAAALSACGASGIGQQAITLVASDPPSWNTYLQDMARALRVPSPRISPARLKAERALAYPLAALGRLGLPVPEVITPGLARLFDQPMRFESSAVPLLLPAWQDYEEVVAEGACWAGAQMEPVRKG